jgi:FAD/FMN-containing dehydrogenase
LIWAAFPDGLGHTGEAIHDIAAGNGGYAAAIRAPIEMRRLPSRVLARNRSLKALSARVKSAFDPSGLLNPGLDLAAEA